MHEQDYILSNYWELVETVVYSLVVFLVPFFIGHSQYLTGIIVNMALVLAAFNIRNEKLLPIIMLPSIAVFARGLIFGPFTMYIVYVMPFIWLGNFLLVYMVKRLSVSSKLNSFVSLGAGAIIKSAFIFAGAYLMFSIGIIPQQLLIPMGIIQLVTAAIGGSLAIGTQRLKKQLVANKGVERC